MNGSQRMWLTALRVFAKIFFVVSVIAGLWWAYTIGRTPFVDTSGLKAGIVVGFTASGFITAVFLNMAGDILEMKCFMKACGGK
jgi:hypothetical protein